MVQPDILEKQSKSLPLGGPPNGKPATVGGAPQRLETLGTSVVARLVRDRQWWPRKSRNCPGVTTGGPGPPPKKSKFGVSKLQKKKPYPDGDKKQSAIMVAVTQ